MDARSLKAFQQQCRRMMHWPLKEQHQRLCRMLQAHYGYFGIAGKYRSLMRLYQLVPRIWHRWLARRSSKSYLTWERFAQVLERLRPPLPRIVHRYAAS